MRARLRGEHGANAVEFALVLPILIVLVFGILWGGISLNQKLTHSQAAREGARFAATLPFQGPDPDADWFDDVSARIDQASTGSLTGDAAYCVRFIHEDGSGPGARFFPGTGTPADAALAARHPNCEVEGVTGPASNRTRVEVITGGRARLDFVMYDFSRYIFSDSVARFEPTIDGP